MKTNLLSVLRQELRAFCRPLLDTEGNREAVLAYFNSIGYDLEKIVQVTGLNQSLDNLLVVLQNLKALSGQIKTANALLKDTIQDLDFPNEIKVDVIKSFAEQLPENAQELIDFYNDDVKPLVDALVSAVKELKQTITIVSQAVQDTNLKTALLQLPQVTLDALTQQYLDGKHKALMPGMEFLTLVTWETPEEITLNSEVVIIKNLTPKFHPDKFGRVLTEQHNVIKEAYWSSGLDQAVTIEAINKIAVPFFRRIQAVLSALGAETSLGLPTANPTGLSAEDKQRLEGMLTWAFKFYDADADRLNNIGASVGLLSTGDSGPGVSLMPFANISIQEQLGSRELNLAVDIDPKGLKINKDGVRWLNAGSTHKATAKLDIKPRPGQENLFVLGGGTRVEIGSPSLKGDFRLENNQPVYGGVLTFGNNKIVISAPESDGFMKQILPKTGVEIPFELGVGWSNDKGFYFAGSAKLDVTLTPKLNLLDILRLNSLRLTMAADQTALSLSARASIGLSLGVLDATIGGVGIQYRWVFPQNGELGTTETKALLPDTIGLSIDTAGFTGGGYLHVENGRYTGVMEVCYQKKINFTAIVILDTQLPGVQQGFSLLMLLSVSGFKEIPLGLGFSLAGIGGLLALHRGMDISVLRAGIQDKSFDSVLFPTQVVSNADAIIRDLDKAFPLRRNSFVFGPTAKIHWGTPKALLKIRLGLFFEFGDNLTIAVPGTLTCILPEEGDRQLVSLRANFLGLLSFAEQEVSFEATIFDSKIGTFTLSGDILARVIWKDGANFLVSAGGFHPRFQPPAGVRQLRRMLVNFLDKDDAKVQLRAYVAITSNSVQIGARVDVLMEKAGFKVIGHVSFDVLFQFNPFRFFINISGSFAVQRDGEDLIAVSVDLYLEGPAPWYFVGKATFTVLGIDVSINIEKKIGDTASATVTLPDENLLLWLKEELLKKENWQIVRDWRKADLFRLRPPDAADAGKVLAPNSNLRIAQTRVPLNTDIQRVGLAKPMAPGMVKITEVTCNNGPALGLSEIGVTAPFAPAHFKNLSDEAKITAPAFENYPAGVRVGFPGQSVIFGKSAAAPDTVEEIVLSAGQRVRTVKAAAPIGSMRLNALLRNGSAGRSVLSPKNTAKSRMAGPSESSPPRRALRRQAVAPTD